jgi:hypothetical protein
MMTPMLPVMVNSLATIQLARRRNIVAARGRQRAHRRHHGPVGLVLEPRESLVDFIGGQHLAAGGVQP